MDKNFYNKSSADSLGWDPTWFDCKYFNDTLVKAVRKWQRQKDLKADGLVGPMTYRRIWTERESKIGEYKPYLYPVSDSSFIVHNGSFIPIDWPKVVLWTDDGGFHSNPGTYYDYSGKADRKPTMFVNHWDVCLSSESCARVLNKRGISVHFLIDNDGTIYQMLDTQHGAWHAGTVNRCSIGVEISNAYYPKYQDWYTSHGFGERPVVEGAKCQGKNLDPFLGFYDVQIEALKALWASCHLAHDIPLAAPESGDESFLTSTREDRDVRNSKFKGFVSHYHQTRNKIDCAGLDIVKLLRDVTINKDLDR